MPGEFIVFNKAGSKGGIDIIKAVLNFYSIPGVTYREYFAVLAGVSFNDVRLHTYRLATGMKQSGIISTYSFSFLEYFIYQFLRIGVAVVCA